MSLKRPNKRKTNPKNPLRKDTAGNVTRLYKIWIEMRSRCMNPKKNNYKWYGGKGIRVCSDWYDYKNFHKEMSESYYSHTKAHGEFNTSIDRIESLGNYCKENCRWATNKIQSRNTTRSIVLTHNGKTQALADWAEELNIGYQTLYSRIFEYNFSVEKALNSNDLHKKMLTFRGKTLNTKETAKRFNIKYVTLVSRINYGWSIEKALTTPVKTYSRCN